MVWACMAADDVAADKGLMMNSEVYRMQLHSTDDPKPTANCFNQSPHLNPTADFHIVKC